MSLIIPIPTSRVGDLFVRQRLTQQAQLDQLAMFELQNQVSTGRRMQLPSDDAPAALRAINLQRVLDRKGQIRTNLQASNFYLSAAENSLGVISKELSDVRGAALGVADTVATDEQRQAVVQHINRTLQLLVETGNAKSQGRYLFAGSRSQDQPYRFNGQYVEFLGNEGTLRSYVDLERLFETNLHGTEVFGGLSSAIQGSADLNPHLTAGTLVSTINGGTGIGSNPAISISINTGVSTATNVVDLSEAVTLGDVARLIEAGAPEGTTVTAEVTGTGLVLRTDENSISVAEVAQGRTARELGIFSDPDDLATDTITGGDLNAAVLKTTRLNGLLGKKAQGVIDPAGMNNRIALTAAQNGAQFNGTIEIVGGGTAGSEQVTYDAMTNTLTIEIQDGVSRASDVAAAITAEGTFSAVVDYHDATSSLHAGTGIIDLGGAPSLTFATLGGTGETLDTASGLILTNGGQEVTLDISDAETVEDLLNLIHGAEIGLLAEINADRDGINVRSRLSGADFTIGENGGTTATQLGIRTYTGATDLADFNRGLGVLTNDIQDDVLEPPVTSDLEIVARNGALLTVDLDGATTLQEVVDRINALNGTGGSDVQASLTADGHGINLVDSSALPTGDLIVQGNEASEYLGFVSAGQPQASGNTPDVDGNYALGSLRHSGEDDLLILAQDGTELWVDLTGATSVQDVIDLINEHPRNTGVIEARLAETGNGIALVDSSVGAGSLTVQSAEGSRAAEYLGFVPAGQTQATSSSGVLQSADRHTLETDSVFNTLMRMRTALEAGDVTEIGRSIDRLDDDLRRMNFARAEIGARVQSLQFIDIRLQDENVQLQAALSQEVDVDLIEAISNLTARQYAFEASLRTAGSLLQLSLLNFI